MGPVHETRGVVRRLVDGDTEETGEGSSGDGLPKEKWCGDGTGQVVGVPLKWVQGSWVDRHSQSATDA
jgi:hypothetical protein